MNLFQDIKIPKDKLHQKFKTLKETLSYSGEQEVLNDWVKDFKDRDGKIVKEFQTTFHSSFWEFYLFAVFKEAGFKIDFSKNRPDFIIKEPYEIYIEAVVSNIKQDGDKEDKRTFDDILSMLEPPHLQSDFYEKLDESIVRHSNAILGKSKKYLQEYSKLEYINTKAPFVIAISGYEQINYGNQFYYPMMALLYGAYYDIKTDDYTMQDSIKKPNSNSDIPIGLFKNKDMEHISAIIFSSTVTLGKLTSLSLSQNKSVYKPNFVMNIRLDNEIPKYKIQKVTNENQEYLTDGLFVFHNPFAKNKLSKDIFNKTNALQIFKHESGFEFVGNNLPIYSRFNNFINTPMFINTIAMETFMKFNSKENLKISHFEVLEVDLDFKEITIRDLYLGLNFIVDLEEKDMEYIKNNEIKEKDKLIATIFSIPDKYGMTTQWNFIDFQKLEKGEKICEN